MSLKLIRERSRNFYPGSIREADEADTDRKHLLSLLDRARAGIKASVHALRSYQYGNSSPDLAEAIADKLEILLREPKG